MGVEWKSGYKMLNVCTYRSKTCVVLCFLWFGFSPGLGKVQDMNHGKHRRHGRTPN